MSRQRQLLRVLRWVMVAVSAAISGLLLARGDYVIGGLIAAFVLFRAVFLIATSRAWFSRRPGNPDATRQVARGLAPVRQILRGIARAEFKVAASVMGMDGSQMQRAFNEGRSIAELAGDRNVALDRVVKAIVADATSRIDVQVAQGTVDAQTAKRARKRLRFWANRLVNLHKGDLIRLGNGARISG